MLVLYSVLTVVETIVTTIKKFTNQTTTLFDDTTATKQTIPQGGDSALVFPQVYNSENERNGMEFSYSTWIFINPDTFEKTVAETCGGSNSKDTTRLKHIFHKGAAGCFPVMAPGVFVHGGKNTLRIYMNSVIHWDSFVEVPNIPIGKWFHMVLIQKGQSFDIFINGNIAVRHQFDAVPKLNTGNIYIMAPVQFPQNPADNKIITDFKVDQGMNGMVSRLKYFAYALNYSQIDSLYREGPSKKIVSKSYSQTPPYFYDNWWVTKY